MPSKKINRLTAMTAQSGRMPWMMKTMAVMPAISVSSISRKRNEMKARVKETGKVWKPIVRAKIGVNKYCCLFFRFIIFPLCSV